MKIEATTPEGSDPPPFARQRHIAEQGRLDRQHIEARHVEARISALEHQHLQLVGGRVVEIRHDTSLANCRDAVQRIVGIYQDATIHKADRPRVAEGAISGIITVYMQVIAKGRAPSAPQMITASVAEANRCIVVTDNKRDLEDIPLVNPLSDAK